MQSHDKTVEDVNSERNAAHRAVENSLRTDIDPLGSSRLARAVPALALSARGASKLTVSGYDSIRRGLSSRMLVAKPCTMHSGTDANYREQKFVTQKCTLVGLNGLFIYCIDKIEQT